MTTSLDHPRVRGEKAHADPTHLWRAGSPPRVRGKVALPAKPPELFGITPACAGKSITPSGATNRNEDHPRVCGEKLIAVSPQTSTLGSPPRVRGKGACAERVPRHNRITPACAGKSSISIVTSRLPWDHPRVCGEKYQPESMILSFAGSPLRVRGKDDHRLQRVIRDGITPACAGKSLL